MKSLVAFSIAAAICAPLGAQNVISARSGLIHYVEGQALLNDAKVELKAAIFPEIPEGAVLRTGDGRAEVLLNPGAFLRLAENSAIRMVSTRLTDSRIEFLEGSALIECDSLLADKGNQLSVTYAGHVTQLVKSGLYRFDSAPAQLSVYAGEADVKTAAADILVVKQGKRLPFEAGLLVEKFNAKPGDAFMRWTRRRAEYIATANVSAAKQVNDRSMNWTSGGWYFNRYFGMYTYLPAGGNWRSPFGYSFYTPSRVHLVYQRPVSPGWGGGGGGIGYRPDYRTTGMAQGGYSGSVAAAGRAASTAAPSTTAAGAASAPVSRQSGQAGGRSR